MARKELGHIELQWRCPNCDGMNPGREKSCQSCGAPQPDDVKFEQAARQELIKDEKLIEQAKAGPDIHCAYCGTRNPGTAEVCSQCGSDISEGTQRESGRVIGAFKTGPAEEIQCPACGSPNPDTAHQCSNCGAKLAVPQDEEIDGEISTLPSLEESSTKRGKMPIFLGLVFALICIGAIVVMILGSRTTDTRGIVQGVQWERSIPIEVFGPVEHDDWWDELPDEAEDISCREEHRYTSSNPEPNSVEVCGTPYTEDSGSGFAEVVQDCEYQVYDDYCSYTLLEWSFAETVTLSGNDFSPVWPDPALSDQQRLGSNRDESYTVIFEADGKTYSLDVDSVNDYQQFDIGSAWTLSVNGFGNVVSVDR